MAKKKIDANQNINKDPIVTILNVVTIIFAGSMVLSSFVAMSVTAVFRNNPKIPEPTHGYTIATALRGVGTFYLTQDQSNSIESYWHIFYVLLALSVFSFLIRIAYKGFMEGWRSDD